MSILLMGMGNFAASHQQRATVDLDYAAAMDLAEAGVNYELRKISTNAANADQSPGVSYNLGSGSFKVYCQNQDGTTPWAAPNDLIVCSTGTIGGVSRTIKVSAIGMGTVTAPYAIFALNQGTFSGGATRINGSTATDGNLAPSGGAAINGAVEFDGPGTGWNGSYPTSSPITFKTDPVLWPTVTQLANSTFPSGGLTWLSTHNDNALSPAISGTALTVGGGGSVTLYGKAGGANYYLTSCAISGGSTVNFDNSAGPITIWMGPVNGNGQSTFSGGSSTVKGDPTKAIRIYSALKTTFTLSGASEFDGGIYVYDNYNGSNIGTFTDSGGSTLDGSVLANNMTISGGSSINYQFAYFTPANGGPSYYGFDNSWLEVGAR